MKVFQTHPIGIDQGETVLFSDFKNFVKIASKMEPEELVAEDATEEVEED